MKYLYKREPLTQDEATQLANACQTGKEKLVIWTLLDTGLRVAELASLGPLSIDWQGHCLRVYGKGGPYGKESKFRVVPLSARARTLLESHFSINDSLGLSVRTIQRLVRQVANRAKIARATSPHVLRHTFAVTSIKRGIPLPILQRALGHDHVETTMIYLNLSPEDVLEEYEKRW